MGGGSIVKVPDTEQQLMNETEFFIVQVGPFHKHKEIKAILWVIGS